MRIFRVLYWPPIALAMWVTDGPDSTQTDRDFYAMLYCAGWTAIIGSTSIILLSALIGSLV